MKSNDFYDKFDASIDNLAVSLARHQEALSVLSNIDWEKAMQNATVNILTALSNTWENTWKPQLVASIENFPNYLLKVAEQQSELLSIDMPELIGDIPEEKN